MPNNTINNDTTTNHAHNAADLKSSYSPSSLIGLNKIILNAITSVSKNINTGNINVAKEILDKNPQFKDVIVNSKEVIEACENRLAYSLSQGDIPMAQYILSFMEEQGVNKEKITEVTNSNEIIEACKNGLTSCLFGGYATMAQKILSFMEEQEIDKTIIQNTLIEAYKDGITHCLRIDKEKITEVTIEACKNDLVYQLSSGNIYGAHTMLSFMEELGISEDEIIENSTLLKNLIGNLNCTSIRDLCKYDSEFLSYIVKNNKTDFSFPNFIKKDLSNNVIKKYCLYAILKEYEESGNFDFYDNKKKLYKILKWHDKRWQDEANINKPFEEGAKVFGYDKMFTYLSGKNINLHDTLFNFSKICELSKKDPKGSESFFNNILAQVAKDGGSYNEGSAHDHLNSIANSLVNTDIDKIIEEAKTLVDVLEDVQELLDIFKSKDDIFSSWNNLKKFMTLKELLEERKLLEELADLKKEDEALYNYIKPLLFHKDSKVDRNAVIEFWKEPDKFFARIDEIAGPMHEILRPSNYKEYGLSGKDLQQAIVNGKLDEIQLIKPYEVTYNVRNMSLSNALKMALGERSKGIEGIAQNPKALFKKIKEHGIDPKKIMAGEEISNEEEMWKILESDEVMKNKISKTVVKATIHKKSDPFGALVGDDTACCMPFGSGKMNEYLTNLGTAIFSVRILKSDGNWRTIAQSVLTANINIGKNASSVLDNIENGQLSDIPLDSFEKPLILTCDNIEVAENYKMQEYIKLIEDTYRVFFKKYLSEYNKLSSFDESKVIIGKENSDALTRLESVPNTYIPTSVIGYSDNLQDESYKLATTSKISMNFTTIHEIKPNITANISKGTYKIITLNVQDVLAIAKLEEVIYSQTRLKNGLADIQNEMTAHLILCELYNKPCFMFKMTNKDKPLGYFIGYERNEKGKKEVYISDFAMLDSKNNKSASAAMLISFLERYIEAYKESQALPPIVAEFREGTSYELIKNSEKLNKLLRKYGLAAKVNEGDVEKRGNEKMHHIKIEINKII